MKYNLLLILNKPSVAVSTAVIEYLSYEAAEAAVSQLRDALEDNTQYSVRFFITSKGE